MNNRVAATWAGVILAAGFVIFTIAWLAWWGVQKWHLERIKSEIRAAGVPRTSADIQPPSLSDSENAAPLLSRGDALLKKPRENMEFILATPGSQSPDRDPVLFDDIKLEKLREQMAKPEVHEVLALSRQASERPGAWFERDYSRGGFMELGGINFLDQARLLTSSAWFYAKQGDAQDAASDLLACSRLGRFGLNDVILIGWLVGVATDSLSLTAAPAALAALPDGAFRREDWQPLSESWAENQRSARIGLARAFDGERIFMAGWVFRDGVSRRIPLSEFVSQSRATDASEAADSMRLTLWVYEYPLRPLFLADHATYLRLLFRLRQMVASSTTNAKEVAALENDIPRTAILTRLTFPALAPVIERLDEYEVRLQLGQLGLALEDFRARQGAYPNSLDELGWPREATIDLFSGKSFIYRADGDSLILYSVGKNRIDDGAITTGKSKDLVWQIER